MGRESDWKLFHKSGRPLDLWRPMQLSFLRCILDQAKVVEKELDGKNKIDIVDFIAKEVNIITNGLFS